MDMEYIIFRMEVCIADFGKIIKGMVMGYKFVPMVLKLRGFGGMESLLNDNFV